MTWFCCERIVRYSKQSSAKSLAWDFTLAGRSFMWHRNNIGPRTVPCGTPEPTVTWCVVWPSSTTCIVLAVRNWVSHACIWPLIPYADSLCRNFLWGTVSKAFEKSSIAQSIWALLLCAFSRSSIVTSSWDSQEYPDLKPWFKLVSMLLSSRCFMRWRQIVFCTIRRSVRLVGSSLWGVYLPFCTRLICSLWASLMVVIRYLAITGIRH